MGVKRTQNTVRYIATLRRGANVVFTPFIQNVIKVRGGDYLEYIFYMRYVRYSAPTADELGRFFSVIGFMISSRGGHLGHLF